MGVFLVLHPTIDLNLGCDSKTHGNMEELMKVHEQTQDILKIGLPFLRWLKASLDEAFQN